MRDANPQPAQNQTDLDELRSRADICRHPRDIWREGVIIQHKLPCDYFKAIQLYTEAANAGDAKSQHALGEMYTEGLGCEKDTKKSFEWYLRAAENGLDWAQCRVGELYQYGIGVTTDRQKAFEWFQKALSQREGNSTAMYHMARWETDATKSLEWYMKGAEAGSDECRLALADKYLNGEGVVQNYKTADRWRYLAYCRRVTRSNHSVVKMTLLILSHLFGALPIISWGLALYWIYRPDWFERKELHLDPLKSKLKEIVYISAGGTLWITLGFGLGAIFKPIGVELGLVISMVVTGLLVSLIDTYQKINYLALKPAELIKAVHQNNT